MPHVIDHPSIGVAEFTLDQLAHAYTTPVHEANEQNADQGDWNYARSGQSWYNGACSLDEVTRLLTDGWKDGARRLTDMTRDLNPPTARARQRRVRWSDDGDELNVDRAMRGEWDSAWRTSRRVWTSGPQTVDLLTAWGGNCDRDGEQLFWQGAAAAVISDVLESAGYGVRITAGIPLRQSWGGSRMGCVLVTLKDETEPARLDSIASVLCHSAVFRTYGFRAMASLPFSASTSACRAIYWTDDVKTAMTEAGIWPEHAVVIGDVTNRESCLREIRRAIASVQGETESES